MAHDKMHDVYNDGSGVTENMQFMHGPGYSTYFPIQPSTAISSLDNFVSEDDVARAVRDGQVRCFADLLLAWLVHGDAALACPTYDLYLLTVIRAVGLWVGDDESEENMRIENLPRRVPINGRRDPWFVSGIYMMSTLVREGSEANLFAHPAFDRAVYESARVGVCRADWKALRFFWN